MPTSEIGKLIRLRRILRPATGKALVVAFDHGIMLGTIPGTEAPREGLKLFCDAGVDALLVSPGTLRRFGDVLAGSRTGIIVRVDWTNMWRGAETMGFEEGRTCAVAAVEDAVRWGADAVITYLFVGLDDPAAEAAEIRRNAEVNRACERFGIIHVIESMARGKRVKKVNSRQMVALHTRIAGELGADLIKTDLLDEEAETAQVVSASLAPVLFAGGVKGEERHVLESVASSMRAGAAGIIFGRNVFQAENPVAFLEAAGRLVHGNARLGVAP
jgi:fructose-bisphosphate aldolase, class I